MLKRNSVEKMLGEEEEKGEIEEEENRFILCVRHT